MHAAGVLSVAAYNVQHTDSMFTDDVRVSHTTHKQLVKLVHQDLMDVIGRESYIDQTHG